LIAAVASISAISQWPRLTISEIPDFVAATAEATDWYQRIAVANDICCSCNDVMTPVTLPAAAVDAEPDQTAGENRLVCSRSHDSETDVTWRITSISSAALLVSAPSSSSGQPPPASIS
jgi:hypothetical protein